MERWLTRAGLALCGAVIAATLVLLGMRLVAGPRTVHHDPCRSKTSQDGCVHDRYTGSPVSRPWLVVLMTLSACAAAIGVALREHDRALSSG